MRYNVHSPCAFHSRIAKSIGVLVAAALVAALGMPSLAQAQTIDTVTYADDPGFTVMWDSDRLDKIAIDSWIVTFTEPDGDKVVLTKASTGQGGLDSADATMVMFNENDLGTWWVQVGACFMPLVKDACPSGQLESSDSVGYTHGMFPAPKDLSASLIPAGVYLSWTIVKGDHGFAKYQYSTDGEDWETAGNGTQVVTVKPGDQTFWVRAQGQSDNDLNTLEGDPGDAESNGMAASVDLTVPMPTPTLPEIALLLLAMLLLGSGAYLLRGRQSGGLTHA